MALSDNEKIAVGFAAFLFLLLTSKKAKADSNGNPIVYNNYIGPPGSLDESYLGIAPTANNRGIRNNNPGNIKFSTSNNWTGKIPQNLNTDPVITNPSHPRYGQPTFEQYYKWWQGIRAMIHLIKNSYIPNGHNTIDEIISRWAAGGNENYKNYVAQRTGKTRTEAISANDEQTIKMIIKSIANFENGQWGANDPEVIEEPSYQTARANL